MKKIIITVLLLFVFVGVKAQDFGIKFGLNYNNWRTSVDLSDLSDPLLSFHGGIFVDFELSDRIVLHPELLYSSKGITILPALDPSVNYHQNYLDMPILISYKISDEFSINLGPEVGFLLSAKAKNDTIDDDIKGVYESLEYGVDFGLSYKTSMGLVFDARFEYGLSGLFKGDTGARQYNQVLQFSIGYIISMNGRGSATNENISF